MGSHSIFSVRRSALLVLVLCLIGLTARQAVAQQPQARVQLDSLDLAALPEGVHATLEVLNVKDADLRDVLRGIAHQYNINLRVDNRIDQHVTVRLASLPVIEALFFLVKEYNLTLTRSGRVLRIGIPPKPPEPPPPPLAITVQDSVLTVNLRDAALDEVVRVVAEQSNRNIVVRQGVRGEVTGRLNRVPLGVGLRTLMQNNGFVIREKNGILHIDRVGLDDAGEEGGATKAFWVEATDSLVNLDVINARIADVLREVAAQMEVNLVTYAAPEERITAKVRGLSLEETFNFLFRGTNITYRKEGDLYYIGNKQTSGIATTRLIRLGHIRADVVLEVIPEAVKENAVIQVVKEHNGLLITGTNDLIVELEGIIEEIDFPTPQILIEALVVDFESTDLFELGVLLGRNEERSAGAANSGYSIGGDSGFDRGFEIGGDGKDANKFISDIGDLFGIRKIGKLPDDFYFNIHALSQEGKANIQSRPQIATLNGHKATISVGTTQYFILRAATPYTSPGQVVVQQTERFETIEASVKLEITPWVSASGEVTAQIRPEFSTPIGEFTPEVPPTIASRILESTVRLKDGETIIMGGLIQESLKETHNKVPILGDIPLLGRLFRSTSKAGRKSELVVFLTPHIFYGDERDNERWQSLQDELDLSGDTQRRLDEGQESRQGGRQ